MKYFQSPERAKYSALSGLNFFSYLLPRASPWAMGTPPFQGSIFFHILFPRGFAPGLWVRRPFRAQFFFISIPQGFALGYGYAVLPGLNSNTLIRSKGFSPERTMYP